MENTSKGFKKPGWEDYYDLEGVENYNIQKANDLFEDIDSKMMEGTNNTDNQLANKKFVNSSITHMAANPRGNWLNWDAVPTDPSLYPADADGYKKPSNNDYMVIQDMTGYVNPEEPSRTYEGTWRFTYVGEWDDEYKKTEDTVIDPTKTYYTRSATEPYVYTEVENPVVEDIDTYYELIPGKEKSGWKPIYQVNEKPLTQEQVDALNSGINSTKRTNYDSHLANKNNPHQVTASQLGLGDVNNTRDIDKPVSTAQQTELDKKVDINQGVAYKDKILGIGADGKVVPIDPPQSGATPEQLATKLDKTAEIKKIAVVTEMPKAVDLYTMYLVVDEEGEWPGLKFTAEEDNRGQISYGRSTVESQVDIDIYTSSDGKTWTPWDGSVINIPSGTSIFVWNKTNTFSKSNNDHISFKVDKAVISGNIMSLLNFGEITPYCFYKLFYGSYFTYINDLYLPATTLAPYCYAYMFAECTNLTTTAPDLPATTLAEYCYYNMFEGCSSLITPPDLPATTLSTGCYSGMFNECINLTTAPDLPATTLVDYCYNGIFYDCTKINSIKLHYTGNFDLNYFNNWAYQVYQTGTLYYNGSDTTRGVSAIPQNWAVQTF